MNRFLMVAVAVLATAASLASAPKQPNGKPSPYDSPLQKAGEGQKVQMACQNRACIDPEFCGIPTMGSKCVLGPGGEGCKEVPC